MKLEPRRVEAFLRDPGSARAVLLYGDDAGLIRERGTALVRLVAGSLDDPFRVVELERDGFSALGAEMASLSMTGGRRVVRVREANDALAAPVGAVLAGSAPGFLVLEGASLAARSKLRALLERAPDAVTIGCYPQEGRALLPVIRETLAAMQVTVDDEAAEWLAGQLGADRGVTRSEIEKLATYAGQGGRVDIAAARLCVGDLSGLQLEDALFAATAGDVAGADRALELALAEGGTPVGVLRAALGHIHRLARARAAMAGGASAADVAREVRPPLFFRRQTAFIQALGRWNPAALAWAAARVAEAERSCKRTGLPAETICRNAVIGLAQRVAVRARG